MAAPVGVVVFSELDMEPKRRRRLSSRRSAGVLPSLAADRVATVLCSGRSREELALLQGRLGLREPFICEHGGAVCIPEGYYPFAVPNARNVTGYQLIEFGLGHREIRRILGKVAGRLAIDVTTDRDMPTEQVAARRRLSAREARRTKRREYSDMFRLVKGTPDDQARLFEGLHEAGLRCIPGNRGCHHVGSAVDYSIGVHLLCSLYRRAWGAIHSVGLTGAASAEQFVHVVDLTMIAGTRDDKGSLNVAYWAEAVVDAVALARQHTAPRPTRARRRRL